ncbi:glycoside hydrolase family 1 protein [Spiroplasma turonicum]|uniref:6-phospho-beta-glucosidase n=1 Tax=Spiroplasma turonicum TaxID=216946 RepID=A0A0K1P6I9_9MOLU|nr:glycoside hydrolase family 1 protein [Spiroplasma turonicum]AKU79936.1 6-phospho-beta-glucosidase [Spiroplasma turonicum]ALX70949.1 6-phospho-beta-glucosidase [Spiroplasma turonicum]
MIKFNKNFKFGVSLSGPQTEGNKNKVNDSIMDFWYNSFPNDFDANIGPNDTIDMYSDYKEHLKWLDEINIESFRTSIQWCRLIKDFKTCEVDTDGYNFYLNYFKEIKKRKIILIVNLHHFDIPYLIYKKGGWETKETINLFYNFAKKCFSLFGDIVDEWTTFNEPMADVDAKYLYGLHFPKKKDFKLSIQVYTNMIIAHSMVTCYFKNNYKDKKISIILNITPAYSRSNSFGDLKATEFQNMLITYSQLDLVLKNKINNNLKEFLIKKDLYPIISEDEKSFIKKSKIDYLSLNYYQPVRVKEKEKTTNETNLNMPTDYYDYYDWPKKIINPYRGWEIYPKGIYDLSILIKNKYNNFPYIISENGMGVENENRFRKKNIINDNYRIKFIKQHLMWLKKAIKEGCNCNGYSLWTFIDCWSWSNSFKNRYGLIEYSLKSKKTINKKSSLYFKKLIENKNN